jgi:hypothetical protein
VNARDGRYPMVSMLLEIASMGKALVDNYIAARHAPSEFKKIPSAGTPDGPRGTAAQPGPAGVPLLITGILSEST